MIYLVGIISSRSLVDILTWGNI